MVISHKHRYLFVECPLTASWAIRHELCKHYAGTPILHKHAAYPEFRETASPEMLDFFVFATVRNPLDMLVSRYCKTMADHRNVHSDPEQARSLKVDYSDLRRYQSLTRSNADFASYFRTYCRRPFGHLIDIASARYDYVIRYEQLQEGFSEVLTRLGIKQVRPVPVLNKTDAKKESWESYYSPDLIEEAKRTCGPFMRKWGYDFPPTWGAHRHSRAAELEYRLVGSLRHWYLSRIRYNPGFQGRLLRRLRSYLVR
jgi:hypothetical protein